MILLYALFVFQVRYTGSGKEYDMHLDVSELQTPEGQPIQFPDNVSVNDITYCLYEAPSL